MTKAIFWDDKAREDYKQAIEYASRDFPLYGELISERILKSIDLLAKINVGRRGRIAGTFEKSVYKTPYIIVYQNDDERIVILHIIHTSKEWNL